MRAGCCIGIALLSLGWVTSIGLAADDSAETFPHRRTIGGAEVEARSGPGSQFYVTDRLPPGTQIDVYRRDPGGWLGIRPPRGSFSWVRRDAIQETSQGDVARVLGADTVCRVGSQVAEVSEHTGQVYLEKDELVELLADPIAGLETIGQLEKQGWCRIAPPAGEFRWVRESDLDKAEPLAAAKPQPGGWKEKTPDAGDVQSLEKSSPDVESDVRPAAWLELKSDPGGMSTADVIQTAAEEEAVDDRPAATVDATEVRADEASAAPRPARQATPSQAPPQLIASDAAPPQAKPASAKPAQDDSEWKPSRAPAAEPDAATPAAGSAKPAELMRVPGDSASLYPPRNIPAAEPPASAPQARTATAQPAPPVGASDASPDRSTGWVALGRVSNEELLDIELRLSVLASQDVHAWRLQPLRDRIETVLPRLNNKADRDRADQLLARIAEFEQLQNRFAQFGQTASNAADPTAKRSGAIPPVGLLDEAEGRFDGSGWLVPVHSTRRIAPPYALLNAQGEVLQYVSPAPGLNLHRYLRKQVGIHGQRGYAAALNKPYLTAERVVDLSRHVR